MKRLPLALIALLLVATPVADASIARTAKTKRVPLLRLKSGKTVITPDPAFVGTLQGLSLAPTLLPPAKPSAKGAFVFPIVGGRLAGRRPAAGRILHYGGLRLSLPDGTHVDLNNPRLNDGKVARVTVQVGSGPRITLGSLDVSDAQFGLTPNVFVLDGAELVLSGVAAQALDTAFATTAFSAGQPVGGLAVAARIGVKLKTFETR